jgi:hypothetical protein
MFYFCSILLVRFLTGIILLSVFTGAQYRALGMYVSLDLLLALLIGPVQLIYVQLSTDKVMVRM